MLRFSRWKIAFIIATCVFGVLYAAPNLLPAERAAALQTGLPSFMPGKTVNLGLDLQGGSHLLFEVDFDAVMRERLDTLVEAARTELRKEKIKYTGLGRSGQMLALSVREAGDVDAAKKILRNLEDGLLDVTATEEGRLSASYTDQALIQIRSQVIGQSMEIIRRRVDETGTKEPIIQRQGQSRILVQLPGIDDPERVKALIGQTAKLTFHLVDENATASGKPTPGARLLPMTEEEGAGAGRTIAVRKTAILTGEMLADSQPQFQDGRPVVGFRFNAIGARRFCDVTRENSGQLFAIVLDDKVISAPVIEEPICGGQGIIRGGDFTVKSVNDLSLLLRAGALPAPLTVIEERTVGPSLGADSIAAGKTALMAGYVFVATLMVLSYGLFGAFAVVALVINVILLFALLSVLQATLTLPGIAGIVLTMGMAVDANVLIFERIREELKSGRTVMSAIEAGYSQAFSTIMDSNLTTLIATALLYMFGTGPVRGFAVTLSFGILTSMFSAVLLTRLMVARWVLTRKPKTLTI